ncbi:MAG: hypothetical protein ACOYBS_10605 [Flavobacterium sp.]
MNYLKITKYIHLIVGFVMVYDAITKWNEDPKPWLSVILAGLAFFTYFFRTKFAKKFEDRDKQNKSKQS